MRALSIVHESTGRSLVREFYPMIFLCFEFGLSENHTRIGGLDSYSYILCYSQRTATADLRSQQKAASYIIKPYLEIFTKINSKHTSQGKNLNVVHDTCKTLRRASATGDTKLSGGKMAASHYNIEKKIFQGNYFADS
jgi:hypothetical protein